jgi:fused signal recognition particle receptor
MEKKIIKLCILVAIISLFLIFAFFFMRNNIKKKYPEVEKPTVEKRKVTFRETLLQSGFGIKLTEEILKEKDLPIYLKEKLVQAKKDVDFNIVLVVGCNGTGKTTSTGNLAKYLKEKDKKIGVVGCDTFRPAAMQQLAEICAKNQIETFIEGKNPSSVAYTGYIHFKEKDIIIFDTAGRNHKDENLRKELEKIHVNLTKNNKVTSIFIADLTVGSVLLDQYETFNSYLKIDGIILTKVDMIQIPGVFYQLMDKFSPSIYGISSHEKLLEYDPQKFTDLISKIS